MDSLAVPAARLRYESLLPLAGRSRALGALYSRVCGSWDWAGDRPRVDVATNRILRWLGGPPERARGLYRRALVSEAREEADSAFFLRHPGALAQWLRPRQAVPRPAGPLLYATLHLGHPVLSCLYLHQQGKSDVRPIIRGLDEGNPMADPKRAWGQRKVRWVGEQLGGNVFGVDPASVASAREHLLEGGALFAALDVPGDVTGRCTTVELFGERASFASGILTVAAMTGATILPVIALSGRDRIEVHFAEPIAAAEVGATESVFASFARFIGRFPEQWWLWPYVVPA